MLANVPDATRWVFLVPHLIAAAGRSAGTPRDVRASTISGKFRHAISTTRVPSNDAAASQSTRLPGPEGVFTPRNHGNSRRDAPVSYRDTGVGWSGDGGRDARHNFPLQAGRCERHGLLSAAPEYEGVSPLKSAHGLYRTGSDRLATR